MPGCVRSSVVASDRRRVSAEIVAPNSSSPTSLRARQLRAEGRGFTARPRNRTGSLRQVSGAGQLYGRTVELHRFEASVRTALAPCALL
jgi:hypothetical protein